MIIIDIPTVPIINGFSYTRTGNMLKAVSKIDLSLELSRIYEIIDQTAINKDSASRLKSEIIRDNGINKWRCNLNLLANEGYN